MTHNHVPHDFHVTISYGDLIGPDLDLDFVYDSYLYVIFFMTWEEFWQI